MHLKIACIWIENRNEHIHYINCKKSYNFASVFFKNNFVIYGIVL